MFFLIQIRGAGHPQKLLTKFCALRDSRAKAHFIRYKTELSQFFIFRLLAQITYYFQLYQGFYLLEDCVKLPCCVTTFFLTELDPMISSSEGLWLK